MRYMLLLLLLVRGALCQYASADLDDVDDAIECFCNHASYGPDVAIGELKSPLHPNNYCDNQDCHYEIEPAASSAVMLVIEYFQTELRHDWLDVSQVYQAGTSLSDVRMMRLTGDDGSLNGKKFVTAIGNGLRLQFHSDGSEHRWRGFRARFVRFNESINYKPCPPVYYEAVSLPAALTGPVRSTGASECFFMINATEKNTDAVKFTMKSIEVDAEVLVYETEDTEALTRTTAIQTFRGATFSLMTEENKSIISRGKSLLVVFLPVPRTAFYISRVNTMAYFRAEFSRVVSPCNCQKTPYIVDPNTRQTSISTPGYPKDYCDNLRCQYDMEGQNVFNTGTTHSALKMTFNSFDMENNVDYMSLYDIRDAARLLMSYTGTTVSSTVFTFNYFKAQIQVHTDASVVRRGFNATVEEIERDNACKCSPRQPREYSGDSEVIDFEMPSDLVGCNYVDCFWTIADPAAEGELKHRIVFDIEYQLQRDGEAIVVQNGANTIRSERVLNPEQKTFVAMPPWRNVEGGQQESFEYNAAGGVLVWFHSAWDRPKLPAGQSTSPLPSAMRKFKLKYQWKQRCVCGEHQLTAGVEWKPLTSPDHPGLYCHNLRCNYTITAPDDHRIVVNITKFETEINEDFLGMYDGQSLLTRRIEWASGLKFYDHLLKSTGKYMLVIFTTDVSIAHSGFSLLYRAESLNPDTAKKEEVERKEIEQEAQVEKQREGEGRGGGGGGGWTVVFVLLLVATLVAAGILLLQHRRGRISLGSKVDTILGGGTRSSSSMGYVNGGTNNQGYARHFSTGQSQMSLVDEDE